MKILLLAWHILVGWAVLGGASVTVWILVAEIARYRRRRIYRTDPSEWRTPVDRSQVHRQIRRVK